MRKSLVLTTMNKFKSIVDSFQANDGALINKYFGHMTRPFKTIEERIETPDGDFFDVEYTEGFETASVVVIIVHGLESGKRTTLVTKICMGMLDKGLQCCLFSFRACDGVMNRTSRAYHLGFTEDLNYLTSLLHQRFPTKRFYLSGFSLGANVSLKLLGELGDEAAKRNIDGAAVTCAPFDPISGQAKLDVGFSRLAYSTTFLETLKAKAEEHNRLHPGIFDIEALRKCQTLGEYDDIFIAKVYGFKDKFDYYRQSGCKWWLDKIRVPCVVINARDDPFIEESTLPTPEEVGEAPIRLIYTQHGGHCGFYTFSSGSPEEGNDAVKPHGWIAEELSRAVVHMINGRRSLNS